MVRSALALRRISIGCLILQKSPSPNLRKAGPARRDGLYRLRGLASLPVAWDV